MAYGVALEQRAIQPRVTPIQDDDYMTNIKTGEVYTHNRAYRRKDVALGVKISKHEGQRRPAHGVKLARKARRKMAAASRRRNR